ncbi:FAD-dependent oxidoreductase, partial [Ferroglobus sp.]|uniref:NAD(P)/FAD-dependent oxidoreductase n=1 Tax=Ferroglobus sp. TaxID=2614230 RepID=UPI0025C4AA2F
GIRSVDKNGRITIISSEKPYTRVFLAEYLAGEASLENLKIKSEEFFERNKVEFLLGLVEEVEEREVTYRDLESGEEKTLNYDRLLIATGSKPFIPPIRGVELNGIFTFWTLKDAESLLSYIRREKCKNAVVVGAGPIGLEVAQSLREMGLNVAVFELMERILPGVADFEVAEFVKKEYEEMGIKIYTAERVEQFYGEGKVKGVSTSNWEDFPADVVVLSTGVRPNVEKFSKFVKTNIGIVVNRRMETSKEGVFAAGDVAEAQDVFGKFSIIGSWINAVSQGKVAGMNMAGRDVRHRGGIRVSTIKKVRTPMVSIGASSEEYERVVFKREDFIRIAYFDGKRLVGFQSAGSFADLKLSGLIQFMISKGIPVENKEEFLRRPFKHFDQKTIFYEWKRVGL